MNRYRQINNITGWVVFLIASTTYLLTVEPTASLWDCGEFIATGFKLEVGHPPGCALFMILTRLFTLLAGKELSKVAVMANSLSALMSAFTVLFLFWTITHLAKKILTRNNDQLSSSSIIAIMGAGIVGSLAFAFTDSFWFSAVEGEVYATSSFFTAVVVWAILRWEDCADEADSSRWIVLVFYLMGLSIGVHLLNLLTLPAIFLIWYFKKRKFSWKGFLATIVLSFILLALFIWGIIPGLVTISTKFDLFFVNKLGLPVNSGMVSHIILMFLLLFYAVWLSIESNNLQKNRIIFISALFFTGIWVISKNIFLNILVLASTSLVVWILANRNRETTNLLFSSLLVIMIGFSSTAIIVIRSSAGTPLNENNPSNPFSLLYYLNREQYGSNPLFIGPYYNAPIKEDKVTNPVYAYNGEKYVITHNNFERKYDDRFVTLFPRMYSASPTHIEYYKSWGGDNGVPVAVTDPVTGDKNLVKVPTFRDNLKFMFSYQFGFMYMRYFLWNFSGKQNDTQGTGGAFEGNWITGFDFIDSFRVGTSKNLPASMASDASRNRYFMLPFLLGLLGLFFQLNKDNKGWWSVLFLFIMTGLAIVFYLNQTPEQPRERDYAYVGSFYFFSVWIGLGMLAIFEWISKLVGNKISAIVSTLICLSVPLILATENWDDHDRSGRYLTRDVAFNYLESCAPDAILFSNGDNDTFPLWYAQEVEDKRTDIRVCNLMLLNTDWYIEQMKKQVYKSAPLPITLPLEKYYDGVNNYIYIVERTKEPVEAATLIDWIMSQNTQTKARTRDGEYLDIVPSRTVRIPVDPGKVIASGVVDISDSSKIVPYIDINLSGSYITKSQLLILDILAHNEWERPIYFVSGYSNDVMGLEEYFQLEGLAYRLVPIKSHNNGWLDYGAIAADIMYDNMMNKFAWGGANDPKVNIDYHHQRNISVIRARLNYAKLAIALAEKGEQDKANKVLDRCMEALPLDKILYDPYVGNIIEAYFKAENRDKAIQMVTDMRSHYYEEIDYFLGQESYLVKSAEYNIQMALQNLSTAASACLGNGEEGLGGEISRDINNYYSRFTAITGSI